MLRAAELRPLEADYADVEPPLMERAGAAAAARALQLLTDPSRPVLICAGPGNNGGDAFVVARLLRAQGIATHVVFRADPDRLPPDARAAFERWRADGGECLSAIPHGDYGLIIDGLFGIGLTRPIRGEYAEWIERINAQPCRILALDIPSGLDGDTGRMLGATVRATHTVTFIADKPGLHTLDGPDCCGEVSVCDLDLPRAASVGALLEFADFRDALRPRLQNSHKGSYGSLAVIGGAAGMTGPCWPRAPRCIWARGGCMSVCSNASRSTRSTQN